MNHYTYSFVVECPNDGAQIDYHLHVECETMIEVERIVAACNYGSPQFHEALADVLHETLGGYHVMIARHQNVTIRTERGERRCPA